MSPLQKTFIKIKSRLKLFCFLLATILFLVLGNSIYQHFFSADKKFEALCDELLAKLYENDVLSCAFSFENPPFETEAVSLLPIYEKDAYTKSISDDSMTNLLKINPDRLSAENANLYEILLDYFTLHDTGRDFLFMEQPLAPSGGAQTSLPVLLAEFPIDERADIDLYLNILKEIPLYLESLGNFEKDRKAAGYITATEDINEIIAQCDDMCSEQGYKLFMDSFQNLITSYNNSSDTPFTASEEEKYVAECEQIVNTMIFPAYEALGDTMLILREEKIERQGLCQTTGTEYYEYLMASKTGSDKSVKEIEAVLQNKFEELATTFNETVALLSDKSVTDNMTLLTENTDETKLLHHLEDVMSKDFPTLPENVTCEVKEVPDCLTPYTAPAYFFTPRVDAYEENAIYINETNVTDAISLFTTLAHEGYPGHMLQSTYFLSTDTTDSMSALQNALNYIGYVEGWAMYVELLSFEHAAFIDGEIPKDTLNFLKALRTDRELRICLYCLLDIRVNMYGDTVEDIAPYLVNIGITSPESHSSIYTYLVNEPATYASYYVGYLELLECKELYQQLCDKTDTPYTEKDFHTFYLECGPSSFSHIKEVLKEQFHAIEASK